LPSVSSRIHALASRFSISLSLLPDLDQTKAPEAKAFSQGADHSLEAMYTKHLAKAEAARASREAAKQQGVDLEALASGVEEAAAIGRMKAFWSTLADPRTGMAQVCDLNK